jgi:hypothetical protein
MKALGALASCALAAAACGPSFQAVYESDVHFEHCYAVDMSELPIEEKRICWREWLAGYTYGESRDRVEHARGRLAALSSDDPPPSGDAGARVDPVVQSSLPTNAFSPMPRVNDAHALDAGDEISHRDGPKGLPGAACADACAQGFTSCHAACKGAACSACDHAYRSCVVPCFADESDAGRAVAAGNRRGS